MVTRISTLESHPQRRLIVDAIAAGRPYREIEGWAVPTVTRGSLSRFKRSAMASTNAAIRAIAIDDKALDKSMRASVTKAALAVAIDPFQARAAKSDARRDRWMDAIEASPDGADYRALSSLDRNDLTAQEYQARLAGRLDSPAAASTTTFVLMPLMGQCTPAAPEVQVIEATDVVFGPDNP